jgi:hypothetical protein
VEGLRATMRSTARELIPKMYQALKDEDPGIAPKDARDRIEKDCRSIWSSRTILEALPHEAKNPEKQKAGRMRQSSAAVSAAPNQKSKCSVIRRIEYNGLEECTGCKELLAENTELKEALGKATVLTKAYDIVEFPQGTKVPFELLLSGENICNIILSDLRKDSCLWVNGIIETSTGKVLCANIGRASRQEVISRIC